MCLCVKKHTPRFDIYSRYPFVWVVCAIIYIKKTILNFNLDFNLDLNPSQFHLPVVLDLNCWKRVAFVPVYICAV